ncbi:hypothetical protein CCR75_009232 [Bremia lactucae]|uniref:Uncharacterized protein n=1 Tax=Bremia lactucae TaxID=4779 RepID=A0A976FNL1_BRELC|nr:hypothetical protein CCR75_009232 [Bremia lactucae]
MHFSILSAVAACSIAVASSESMDRDKIVPFPEIEPQSELDKLMLKYKPQLHISSGCQPYPAVDQHGYTSDGLGVSKVGTSCDGSPLGSQVYARFLEFNSLYGIMYAWYFPREYILRPFGNRHSWENAVVWLKKKDDHKLLAVAASGMVTYRKYEPVDDENLDGDSIKLKYTYLLTSRHYLKATTDKGEKQNLISWTNLTGPALEALQTKDSFGGYTPLCDHEFAQNMELSFPFSIFED